MTPPWVETTSIGTLLAEHLAQPGVVFRYNRWLYRTTGQHISQGGMGTVYRLDRRADGDERVEVVVGKTFHANYLYQLRTDEITRRDHHTTLAATARIAALEHPNVLPIYVA